MSNKSRDVIFSENKTKLRERSTTSPRAWFHYLPLFAANRLVICRYLPLIEFNLPLFAATGNALPLFAANVV
jgi:hypothetical protein